MKTIVFAGASIGLEEAQELSDAEPRPPARRGDIYAACRDGAGSICLIDGFFEHEQRVTHSEILWALANGVHVKGAAGLGALRAAELQDFGMAGVGQVFEACCRLPVIAEDRFAFAITGADQGWRRSSEPFFNVEATLQAALEEGAIRLATRDRFLSVARRTHYKDLNFEGIVGHRSSDGSDDDEVRAFTAWLPAGKRDLLLSDSIAVLRSMLGTGSGRTRRSVVPVEYVDTWARQSLREEVFMRPEWRDVPQKRLALATGRTR